MAITELYFPNPPPPTQPELRRYLDDELNAVAARLNGMRTGLYLTPLAAAPSRVQDGMIVYADGTNWNPGSGAGFYGRVGGAWQKL